MNSFSEILKYHRKQNGVTLRELAENVSMSYSHLSKIENGKRNPPAKDKIIEIANKINPDNDLINSELLYHAGYMSDKEFLFKTDSVMEDVYDIAFVLTQEHQDVVVNLQEGGYNLSLTLKPEDKQFMLDTLKSYLIAKGSVDKVLNEAEQMDMDIEKEKLINEQGVNPEDLEDD